MKQFASLMVFGLVGDIQKDALRDFGTLGSPWTVIKRHRPSVQGVMHGQSWTSRSLVMLAGIPFLQIQFTSMTFYLRRNEKIEEPVLQTRKTGW